MSLIGSRKVLILSPPSSDSLFSQVQSLFQDGAVAGGLYNISDLTSLYEDRSATPSTPASVDGVVGTVLDLSGNDKHFIAPTDGARATLRESGGYYYLDFSGSQYYRADSMSVSQINTVFFAIRADVSATQYIIGSLYATPRQRFGRDSSGDVQAGAFSDADTGFDVVSGQDYIGQIEMNGSSSVHRQNGVDGSTFNPGTSFILGSQLGASQGSAGWRSRIYGAGIIASQLSSGEKSIVDAWLASLNGVSL